MAKDREGRYYYSFSELDMWERCERQYFWRRIMGKKVPPGFALEFGICLESPENLSATKKIKEEKPLHTDEAKDCFHEDWMVRAKNIQWTEDEFVEANSDKFVDLRNYYEKRAHSILETCHEPFQDSLNMRDGDLEGSVQEMGKINIKDFDYYISLRLDFRTANNELRDLKTSKRRWTESKLKKIYQPSVQIFYCKQKYKDFKDFKYDFFYNKKKPDYESISVERNPRDFNIFLQRIAHMDFQLRGIERAGNDKIFFKPCSQDNFLCDPRYCGYYKLCVKDGIL